jgi:NTE family protein
LGLAHVGVLKYLSEHHIPVDLVAGTSMGAVIGGFYATGHDANDLDKLVRKMDWDRLLRATPEFDDLPIAEKQDWNRTAVGLRLRLGRKLALPSGINPGQPLALLLSRETLGYSDVGSFDDLPIPFRCVATDLVRGEPYVFDRGLLPKAIRASIAIPAAFTPVRFNGRLLVDGGLVDNLPTDIVRGMGAEQVIAVTVNGPLVKEGDLRTLTGILTQAAEIAVLQSERRNEKLADLVVAVRIEKSELTNYQHAIDIMEAGYRAAARQAAELKQYEISEEEYHEYLRGIAARRKSSPDRAPLVRVASNQPAVQQDAQQEVGRKLPPVPNQRQLEETVTGIAAATSLPSAFYGYQQGANGPNSNPGFNSTSKAGYWLQLEDREDRSLTITPALYYQSSAGEPTRAALKLESSFVTRDAYKQRVLTDVTIGYDPGFRTEFYRPFGSTPFFVAPGMMVQREHELLYTGAARTELVKDRFAGTFFAGLGTWRFVQLRVGATGGYESYSRNLTLDKLTANDTAFVDPEVNLLYNTQDSGGFPSRGTRLTGAMGYSLREHSYPYLRINANYFRKLSEPVSLFALGSTGSSLGKNLTFYDRFTSGGGGMLDAFRYQEFRANTLQTLGGGAVYRIPKDLLLNFRPSVAAWYQAGRFDLGSAGWQTHQSTSFGVFAPTPLGVTGLSVSFTERGKARLRLSLGGF